jgi:hypothetical protein
MDSWEKDGKKETKIYVKAQDIRFSNVGSQKQETGAVEKTEVKSEKNENSSDDFSDVPF